jgi:hypothetical protein
MTPATILAGAAMLAILGGVAGFAATGPLTSRATPPREGAAVTVA